MERAKIFLFEDHGLTREYMVMLLKNLGHTVTVEAVSVKEAEEAVASLEEGDIDVALLDGNFLRDKGTESEGAEVAALLGEKFPGLPIIGMSGSGRDIIGATHKVEKIDFNQATKIIADL